MKQVRDNYRVCCRHFTERDKIPDGKGRRGSDLKADAVPTLYLPGQDVDSSHGEERISPVSTVIATTNTEVSKDTNHTATIHSNAGVECLKTLVAEDLVSHTTDNLEITEYEDESSNVTSCRLCLNENGTINIFDECIEGNVSISEAITTCFHPIEVAENDSLPKHICEVCCNFLNSFYKFRTTVLRNCLTQRELHRNHKHKSEKQTSVPLKRIKVSTNLFDTSTNRESTNMKTVEKQLRKVLEENLTEDVANAENLIIHVQDEREFSEPISVLRMHHNVINTSSGMNGVSYKSIIHSDNTVKRVLTTNRVDVNVSKAVEMNVKHLSSTGKFKAVGITYHNCLFSLIDGYLFEYRLQKGDNKYLKCILPTCKSIALQDAAGDVLLHQATVLEPHNHKKMSESERKKQLFFYMIKRKMKNDKNIINVYEEMCKLDPCMKKLVPLRSLISEIWSRDSNDDIPVINTFEELYDHIDKDNFYILQFTVTGRQFFQEKFTAEDGSRAILFSNKEILEELSSRKLMYVDASFKVDVDSGEKFQLVTILIWLNDSYYPAVFILINKKSHSIYKTIFQYLHDHLAPNLRPDEIITDYEANLYYALGETYLESSIGGSVFYYVQNLYRKVCQLNLCQQLEGDAWFKNIYHMLCMLPLLPVNTILDGLNNLETQAKTLKIYEMVEPLFKHVRCEWVEKVTPDLFCVHRLENRINENIMTPFKKLRDFLVSSKVKNLPTVVEKLIELENFIQVVYSDPNKKTFARDLSSTQKKNILRVWQYIESRPRININNFSAKVLGYIKCMENQLWIWGFYRYNGDFTDELINATNFSIIMHDSPAMEEKAATTSIVRQVQRNSDQLLLLEGDHENIDNEQAPQTIIEEREAVVMVHQHVISTADACNSGVVMEFEL